MASSYAAIIFDVDGTLISSGGAGGRSWGHASQRLYGQEADITEFTDTGMTDPEVATEVFKYVHDREPSDEELATLIAAYLWFIPDLVAASEGYEVLPGARETLERLGEQGMPVGIVTGAVEAACHVKLGRGGLNALLAFGAFSSDAPAREEILRIAVRRAGEHVGRELTPEECLVVGDTPKDVEAAKAVGCPSLAVASHKYSRDELAETDPTQLLNALTEPIPGL